MKKCKTSGTTYSIVVQNGTPTLSIVISLPHLLDLSAKHLRKLKHQLHNGVEEVLSKTFDFYSYTRYGGPRSPHYMVIREDKE